MTRDTPCRTLWLVREPGPARDGDLAVVLDAAWTPDAATAAAGRVVPIRDTVDAVLHRFDPIAETSALLDDWAPRSGVVEALTIGGTSFWYYVRLRHWMWLQERVLWAQVLRELVASAGPARIACAADTDAALVDVARLMAAADGLELEVADDDAAPPAAGPDAALDARRGASAGVAPGSSPVRRPPLGPLVRRLRRLVPGMRPGRPALAWVEARVAPLAREAEGRLLVVQTHQPQRVETSTGPRLMNPYLGSVADRLAGTTLDPIVIDWRARLSDAAAVARIWEAGSERVLPRDVILLGDEPVEAAVTERAEAAARRFATVREPVLTCGIDLGPGLARDVGETALRWFPAKHATVARLGRVIRRLHVRGLLLADEYHRQDWMEAAAAAGIPVAAIQHGTINRHHRGYIHAERPPTLRLPARTYVFGSWERERLVDDSVYRADEVIVGGSPRLDLYRPSSVDRDAVRAELGVAPGDRLVVLSGTWGEIYRRFQYPVVLARLFDRPMPRVHLVVKQHPGEEDEGPYRAVVEGVAAARGFAPPPVTLVRDVDLYRVLGAADAHLGIHSTVLTEAVFVGTPNLLATGALGGDLLDYVEAGVAVPVADGGDLLAALDAGPVATAEARRAFIARHFEPGDATRRIADDLLDWLA